MCMSEMCACASEYMFVQTCMPAHVCVSACVYMVMVVVTCDDDDDGDGCQAKLYSYIGMCWLSVVVLLQLNVMLVHHGCL